jgi:hypothetical protein
MKLPTSKKDLASFAQDIVVACKSSQGIRSSAYRQYSQWLETGRQAGSLALANLLYSHIDRLHSHLFSPTDLRFSIDFENHYDSKILNQADMGSRVLTREWERRNIDSVFAAGVREALTFGACPIKLLASGDGESDINLSARLVMPWCFGVYNESNSEIEEQEAVVETAFLTKPEVWRRISHLPDADKLFYKIIHNSNKTEGEGSPTSFFHQVLSTMALDTTMTSASSQVPGGIVQLANGPSYGVIGPQVGIELYPMHEIWVKDDDLNDYVTIQIFEPDILVAPQFARKNLLAPGCLPYRVIRPNDTANYFWGRSELVDLMMLQQLLTQTLDDMRRIMGNQFDKLLFFKGDGLSDETYGQFRSQGWGNLGPNGGVEDMTPKMPPESFKFVEMIMSLMDKVSGFSPVLSGQGEQGVRAGSHADTLMRTASPRLRDRSLLVERQCASFADLTLSVMEAKDGRAYWTDEDKSPEGEFLLSQLPEDRRVIVDSHSSSPIYHDDHLQLLFAMAKLGAIGPDTLIDLSSIPNKDILKDRLKKIQEAKAKAAQEEQKKDLEEAAIKHGGK